MLRFVDMKGVVLFLRIFFRKKKMLPKDLVDAGQAAFLTNQVRKGVRKGVREEVGCRNVRR